MLPAAIKSDIFIALFMWQEYDISFSLRCLVILFLNEIFMIIHIKETVDMKLFYKIFLALFLLSFSHHVSAQDITSYSSVNVEKASLTRTELVSRSAAVKVSTDRGFGSGIFVQIARKRVVFTSYHVVRDTHRITILSGDSVSPGEIIYFDEENDFAILSTQGIPVNRAIRLRVKVESTSDMVGTRVHYSGYPAGHSLLTIRGTVAGFDRGCYIVQSYGWLGASGSGVFDSDGRLVGILTAIDFSSAGPSPQLIESIVWIIPVSNINMSRVETAIREKL